MEKNNKVNHNTETWIELPDMDRIDDNGIELKAGDKILIDKTLYLITYTGESGMKNILKAINMQTGKILDIDTSRQLIHKFKQRGNVYLCTSVSIKVDRVKAL